MYAVRKITDDLTYVGASDRRIALFENVYPAPNGASFNAYVLLDEKTVLFDTCDRAVADRFFENLTHALNGRALDYLFVHHVEPDHSYAISEVIRRYPGVSLVLSQKAHEMLNQFYRLGDAARVNIVKEGDTLLTGRHNFRFIASPMVHWPEVMFSYDETDKVLFSADAFGAFGALGGDIFSDELDIKCEWIPEMRRYYTNIVGKYGPQVQAVLKKAAALDIALICPLHGPVWRKGIDEITAKYLLWSAYTPEEESVLICYASVYGATENAAMALAMTLGERGIRTRAFDVSKTHASYLIAEAFRASHLVLAAPTYNMGVFATMDHLIHELTARGLKNRTVAIIENGSWACASGKLMEEAMGEKNTVLSERLSIKSAPGEDMRDPLERLADAIEKTVAPAPLATAGEIDNKALFKLSYGLFVLSAREGGKDNGCIINTVTQLTDQPKRVTIAVNKQNLTCAMIAKTGLFNVSVLDESAPFELFKRFGFQSGRAADKFAGLSDIRRTANGLYAMAAHANAVLCCRVTDQIDYGTHILFVADIDACQTLSDAPSVTYAYYFARIKPAPESAPQKKKGFVCKICGYVYEGDVLPEDFICPICKHGAADFEPLQ